MILELDGRAYMLSSVNISRYNRGAEYGPTPGDNTLQFQIRTLKMDNFLWNWAGSEQVVKKNGKVKLLDATNNSLLQTYSFEDGFCMSNSMSFYSASDVSEVSITVAASKISVEIHENMTSPVSAGRA